MSKISFVGVSEETLILLDIIWFDQVEEFNIKERANSSWDETSEEKKLELEDTQAENLSKEMFL